ncbi:MAG TPA: glycosyltransferase [Candidatus Saccharimonadales bacterium]|nr:glycosyltransferase [Candidatus Saccharimonadales bacterium]
MKLVLAVFLAGVLLELALHYIPALWRARKVVAVLCVVLTAFACDSIALWKPNVCSVLIGIIGLYRVFNYLRIAEGRMHEGYLRRATRRTSLLLIAFQAVIALYWLAWHAYEPSAQVAWLVVTLAQCGVAALLLVSTIRSLRHTAWPARTTHISDADLPTVTVAVPARNETEDLQACLESLIGCDYPKLEIIVLDDCSQTKRTPEIIRGYAHDGVRFIQGNEPLETWLAKNQAYDRLADEASGEYIVFAGVDTRFGRSSIRQLVELLTAKRKQMISVLPYRSDSVQHQNALAQAMRYFWELVPPRRLFNRPPVLSSCWIIQSSALGKAGGFEAVSRAIVPEAHFAKRLVATDGYSFMRSSREAGIESVKSLVDQWDTAVRTRYPQLHRRPENVVAAALAVALFLLLPYLLAVSGYFLHIGAFAIVLAAIATVLLTATFWLMNTAVRTGNIVLALIGMPAGALYDLWLLHYSMWQYEFSTVEWKGRNVCIPAMHVIPHLPKI